MGASESRTRPYFMESPSDEGVTRFCRVGRRDRFNHFPFSGSPKGLPAFWGEEAPQAIRGLPLAADPGLAVRAPTSLHNMLLRAVVPDAHAHVLPGAGGIFGDGRAVELRRKPALRVQARIRPCHVRAVPLILTAGLVLAVLAVLVAILVVALIAALVLAALIAGLVLAVVLFGQCYHLAGSLCRSGTIMRRRCKFRPWARRGVRRDLCTWENNSKTGDFSLTIRGN